MLELVAKSLSLQESIKLSVFLGPLWPLKAAEKLSRHCHFQQFPHPPSLIVKAFLMDIFFVTFPKQMKIQVTIYISASTRSLEWCGYSGTDVLKIFHGAIQCMYIRRPHQLICRNYTRISHIYARDQSIALSLSISPLPSKHKQVVSWNASVLPLPRLLLIHSCKL